MQLNLTTWQRLTLLQMMNGVQGDLRTVNKALKLIDLLELTPEEQEAIGLQATPDGTIRWADNGQRFELEVKDGNLAAFLKEQVEAKQDWPAVADVVDLAEQLGIGADDV